MNDTIAEAASEVTLLREIERRHGRQFERLLVFVEVARNLVEQRAVDVAIDARLGGQHGSDGDGELLVLGNVLAQVDGLGELNRDATEIEVDELGERGADESGGRGLGLALAGELARMALLLDDTLVVDGDGADVDVLDATREYGVDDDREHAELWRQALVAATARALEEELERMAVLEERGNVLGKELAVEGVVSEAATHEEGARVAKDPTDEEHVEKVVAGGDARHREVVVEEDVGEEEEVDVATMRRDEHERRVLGGLLHEAHAELVEQDGAVEVAVDLAKEVALGTQHRHRDGALHAGEDLVRALLDLRQRHVVALGLGGHGEAHGARGEHGAREGLGRMGAVNVVDVGRAVVGPGKVAADVAAQRERQRAIEQRVRHVGLAQNEDLHAVEEREQILLPVDLLHVKVEVALVLRRHAVPDLVRVLGVEDPLVVDKVVKVVGDRLDALGELAPRLGLLALLLGAEQGGVRREGLDRHAVLQKVQHVVQRVGRDKVEVGLGEDAARRAAHEVRQDGLAHKGPRERLVGARAALAHEHAVAAVGNVGRGGDQRVDDRVGRHLVADRVGTAREHELHDADAGREIQRRSGRDDVEPAGRRLLVRGADDARAEDEQRHLLATLRKQVLGERLGEGIRVGIATDQLGSEALELGRIGVEQHLEHLLRRVVERIQLLLDRALLVAVDVRGRDVRKGLEMRAALGDRKETQSAENVEVHRNVHRLVEVDGSRRVDKDVDLALDRANVVGRETALLLADVAGHGADLGGNQLRISLGTELETQAIEHTTIHQASKTALRTSVLLGAYQQVDLGDIGTRAQQLLDNDLANEPSGARDKHGTPCKLGCNTHDKDNRNQRTEQHTIPPAHTNTTTQRSVEVWWLLRSAGGRERKRKRSRTTRKTQHRTEQVPGEGDKYSRGIRAQM